MKSKINIKLRRDLLSPERIDRHKNYSNVLRQFERKKRFDRAKKLFVYSLVIAVIVLFLVLGAVWVYLRLAKEKSERKNNQSALIIKSADHFEWS